MAKAKDPKKSESFLESKAFKSFMAKLYGWGAAIVIVGALFKIQHWPGAGLMLTIGLSIEALIFFVSAFDKQKQVHWERVYPELGIDDEEYEKAKEETHQPKSISAEIERMLEEAKIEQSMVQKLGDGMNKFATTLDGLKEVSNASVATNDYTSKVKTAADNLEKANHAYGKSAEAMTTLAESSGSAKEYFYQIQQASKNLSALNSMYEVEINQQSRHKDVLTQYHEKLASVVGNLADVGSLSVELKDGFAKLNENLSSLNNVYGNMLTAMRR
jgi:gliding motility-associated protein GldL